MSAQPAAGAVAPASLADWMRPPGSGWAFRHVGELIPSVRVAAGEPAPLRSAPVTGLLEIAVGGSRGKDRTLGSYLEDSQTDALIVLHRGRIALEFYGPEVSADDRHIVFSVSKSLTGLLAGALAGAGLLELDVAVVHYVPEAESSGYRDASVRHLLDMTAGVRFTEDYSHGAQIMRRYRRATGWIPGAGDEGLHAFLCSIERDGPHGTRFRYLSPNIDLLGWVCERASGLPFAQALSRHLWSRIGAEADAEVTVDRYGAARAAGGISATPRDLARVGQLVLDGGREIVPGWFVDDLLHGGDRSLWAKGDYAQEFPGAAYRSCWYALRTDPGLLAAFGIHGQMVYVDRGAQVVVAKQSHWPEPDEGQGDQAAVAAGAAIARALSG